ncbi:MAG: CoxG family protein [Vulcanimicrobiaceae bacterium]
MNRTYSGREQIPLPKERVWAFITDPHNIAACLPDVVETTYSGDRNFVSTVRVAVGPVRGTFKFNVTLEPHDDRRTMGLTINGGGFGSAVDLTAGAEVAGTGEATTLDWKGDAVMRGPIATVGGRVLDQQANRVISRTFANIKTKMMQTAGAS